MEREIKRFAFNASQNRVTVTITSAPCEPESVAARLQLAEILQNCVANPAFLFCDTKLFERGNIRHDGSRWIFILEANVLKGE